MSCLLHDCSKSKHQRNKKKKNRKKRFDLASTNYGCWRWCGYDVLDSQCSFKLTCLVCACDFDDVRSPHSTLNWLINNCLWNFFFCLTFPNHPPIVMPFNSMGMHETRGECVQQRTGEREKRNDCGYGQPRFNHTTIFTCIFNGTKKWRIIEWRGVANCHCELVVDDSLCVCVRRANTSAHFASRTIDNTRGVLRHYLNDAIRKFNRAPKYGVRSSVRTLLSHLSENVFLIVWIHASDTRPMCDMTHFS